MSSVLEKSSDRTALLSFARDLVAQLEPPQAVDYKIRKDCPICRRFITQAQVTHPGTVDIVPQDGGWWQLVHTRCLRQFVAQSYGAEVVIDISGPESEQEGAR
ncbi:hypothetical protein [Sulfobacillus harzensis]|uniref:Uncharacterized protein n=1 Tax=Sulfobacillus harzensis TaxID=2729629 RepID=A0A7Y0Q3W6_9FIRM|nr:hypothetical protein [Sulfobacillus harzensis]NMP23795.1 hypothetical protein [Sulfobacillus harzensis]